MKILIGSVIVLSVIIVLLIIFFGILLKELNDRLEFEANINEKLKDHLEEEIKNNNNLQKLYYELAKRG